MAIGVKIAVNLSHKRLSGETKHIGLTETPPKSPGLRGFIINRASSGIPFLREFKEVLKNGLPLESR